MGIGDVFEIPGDGIIIEQNFTVCFWFLFPLPEKREDSKASINIFYSKIKESFHTVMQDSDGLGGILVIDKES